MKLIAHRRNTITDLASTPHTYGVEIDIRSHGDRLILNHDPFRDGESFDAWLEAYRHGTIILNVKEEGLEEAVIGRLQSRGIADYFFLDQSFPFLLKTSARGERRCAARVSEFESIDTVLALEGRIEWVWVDCFTRFPLDRRDWLRLTDAGFQLCLVSPDLVGRASTEEIHDWRRRFQEWNVEPDAVCAKAHMINAWSTPLK